MRNYINIRKKESDFGGEAKSGKQEMKKKLCVKYVTNTVPLD